MLTINNKKILCRIFICLCINILLLLLLYNLPIESKHSVCIYKNITGKECYNCGMTRAFLSVLHFEFKQAFNYNWKVIIVFPLTLVIYLNSWYKYIFKSKKNTKFDKM